MRTLLGDWRWRPNELRRRSDVVEAWTVLAVAVLLVLGAPLTGFAAAWWAYGDAHARAEVLRAERHAVRAEVVGDTRPPVPSAQIGRPVTQRVAVRWTDPDGAVRTSRAAVPAEARRGEVVDLWLDSGGRTVPPPPGSSAVWQHSLAMGICGTAGAAAVVLLGHSVVRRTAERHRLAEWERDWARTEPEWTRRRA
ncbi:Rv1733c family protein [Streptomyces sp. enrichment culture]|uniref:Rv1733c family protein n=1 Tax=Streptomyces sp. enrichment culture TaxID=1795815 RepID=UPI003F570957